MTTEDTYGRSMSFESSTTLLPQPDIKDNSGPSSIGSEVIGQGQVQGHKLEQELTSKSEASEVAMDTSDGQSVSRSSAQSDCKGESTDTTSEGGKHVGHPPPLLRRVSTQVLDCSDPLQNYQETKDESIFERKGSLHEVKHDVSNRCVFL